jgi:ATP-binding cassette subfamily B protein
VYLADKIVVLERGRVIEEGTQAQLLQNKSRFAELFQYQKEKFEVPQQNEP